MKNIKYQFGWKESESQLKGKVFLFCIEEKCMSGKVAKVEKIGVDLFEIEINFIDPNYFESDLSFGKDITIQEASKVVSKGKIIIE